MSLHSSALKYFDAVAEQGSIRRAARMLNVSSSSVNRQILALEAEFGAPLFERFAKGVRLSPAGQIVLEHVRRTLSDLDQVRSDIDALNGMRSGRIAVATVASVGTTLLSSAIADFRRVFPGIDFDIITTNSVAVADLVIRGEADIGFSFDPGGRSHLREFFGVDLPLGAIMAADHPLAKRRRLTLGQCLEFDLVLPSPTLSNRDIIDAHLLRQPARPRICLEVDSLSIIKGLVVRGAGISFQTEIGLDPELAQGQLVFTKLQDPDLQSDRFVVSGSATRVLPVPAQVFVDHTSAALTAHFAT